MKAIVDFFGTLFDLIGSSLETSMWMIKTIPDLATTVAMVFNYAPGFLQPFLQVCINVTIVLGIVRFIF